MTKIKPILIDQIFGMSQKIKGTNTTLRIIPNFTTEADFYKISLDRKVIGNTTFSVSNEAKICNKSAKDFPESWKLETDETKLKPFLFISYIELLKEKSKGLGRNAMQLLYKISCKKSCEGRMLLQASKQTAGFYSHLGFDCLAADKITFDQKYAQSLNLATRDTLNKRDFIHILHKLGCPRKINGKYNSDGVRFFIPNEENLAYLFKN